MLTTTSDFIEIKMTQRDIRLAENRAALLGRLKNSITKGEGNFAGFLGEAAVKNYLKGEYSRDLSVYNHDIIVCGSRIEVKSKRRNVPPKLEYEVSVAKTSTHQHPDFYVFTSVSKDKVWILGFISFEEYFDKARFVPYGEFDKSNGFSCHQEMFNLRHSELYPMKEFDVLSHSRS